MHQMCKHYNLLSWTINEMKLNGEQIELDGRENYKVGSKVPINKWIMFVNDCKQFCKRSDRKKHK